MELLETTEARDAADEACTAEIAECNCPDVCERDHDND
jgi:hypothetical protein